MTRAEDLRRQKVDCGQRRYSGHKSDRRRLECHQGKLGTWMPSAESWAFLIQRWIVPDASNNWRWKEGREQDVELPCCFFLPTKSSAISTRKCHLEFSSESGETARYGGIQELHLLHRSCRSMTTSKSSREHFESVTATRSQKTATCHSRNNQNHSQDQKWCSFQDCFRLRARIGS